MAARLPAGLCRSLPTVPHFAVAGSLLLFVVESGHLAFFRIGPALCRRHDAFRNSAFLPFHLNSTSRSSRTGLVTSPPSASRANFPSGLFLMLSKFPLGWVRTQTFLFKSADYLPFDSVPALFYRSLSTLVFSRWANSPTFVFRGKRLSWPQAPRVNFTAVLSKALFFRAF